MWSSQLPSRSLLIRFSTSVTISMKMQFMFLSLLWLVIGITDASGTDIRGLQGESADNTGNSDATENVNTRHSPPEFVSSFVTTDANIQEIMGLMSSHFNISLDYLFASKFFGSQYAEHPGITKLLVKESDRHWEEGINVLKKYLQLGGTAEESTFTKHMKFAGKNDLIGQNKSNIQASSNTYTACLKTMVENSHCLLKSLTTLNHKANRRGDDQKVNRKAADQTAIKKNGGDAAVAHFIQEKAEKELEVARKVVGYYMTLQNMDNLGIALDTFDKELKASL